MGGSWDWVLDSCHLNRKQSVHLLPRSVYSNPPIHGKFLQAPCCYRFFFFPFPSHTFPQSRPGCPDSPFTPRILSFNYSNIQPWTFATSGPACLLVLYSVESGCARIESPLVSLTRFVPTLDKPSATTICTQRHRSLLHRTSKREVPSSQRWPCKLCTSSS